MSDTDIDAEPLESAEEVLEEAPCGFVSSLPDGTILMVNAKLVEWTGRPREQLCTVTRLQDLFPKGEQIYFETHIRPLLLVQGSVKEIACHLLRPSRPALPVFMNCSVKLDDLGQVSLIRTAFFDATDRQKYEEELRLRRHQADWLSAIVSSSKDAIISFGLDLVVRTWNAGAHELFGYSAEEAVGQSIDSLIVPASKVIERENFFQAVLENNDIQTIETERSHKNGHLIPVELRASTIRDESEAITGISVLFSDISERKKADNRIKFVLNELNHRSKNMMGIVQSVVRLSSKLGDPESFSDDLYARLSSLSANQDLLIKSEWRSVRLMDLIHTQIDHFCSDPQVQLQLKGDTVDLAPHVAQSLGMAFHELATNAVKYGALSKRDGQISITWHVTSQFEIEWTEKNGLPVVEPSHTGFGSTVITTMVEAATNGQVEIKYRPSGFVWKLKAPHDAIQNEAG